MSRKISAADGAQARAEHRDGAGASALGHGSFGGFFKRRLRFDGLRGQIGGAGGQE